MPRAQDPGQDRARNSIPRLGGQDGVTIVEVLVAILILVAGLLGTVTMINGANATSLTNNLRETANNLSREIVESANAIPYTSVTTNGLVPALQAQPGLGDDSTAAGWQIIRHGITYTVTATACRVDDSVDGLGSHPGADPVYCAGSTGPTDSNPDDYRRVTINVTWTHRNVTRSVKQVVIANVSRASASVTAAAKSVSIISCSPAAGCNAQALSTGEVGPCYGYTSTSCFPSATTCGATCASVLNFSVTTTGSPAAVKWAVDGVVQGNASGSGNSWTFVWSLGTSYPQANEDGTYEVSAQAYDVADAPTGDPAVMTVTLNRFTPDQGSLGQIAAGKNPLWSNFPEMEAQPSPSGARVDRDIIGYTAFRYWVAVKNGPTQSAMLSDCYLSDTPVCQDTETFTAPDWLNYELVPNDRAPSGEVRFAGNQITCNNSLGDKPRCSFDVNNSNNRPSRPSNLTATSSSGTVTLSWDVPNNNGGAGDSDNGDCVDTFRIYRAPTTQSQPTFSDRYDRTPFGVIDSNCGATASNSYEDLNTDGVQHKYWVTSVDKNLAESSLLGPVTR